MSALIVLLVVVGLVAGFAFLLSPGRPDSAELVNAEAGPAYEPIRVDSTPPDPQTSLWVQDVAHPLFLVHEGLGSDLDHHEA
jgi:hypothetical protein